MNILDILFLNGDIDLGQWFSLHFAIPFICLLVFGVWYIIKR